MLAPSCGNGTMLCNIFLNLTEHDQSAVFQKAEGTLKEDFEYKETAKNVEKTWALEHSLL